MAPPPDPSLVPAIRAASRTLVRELGVLNRTIAGTGLSVSAVHAIMEFGAAGPLSATDLADRLRLEKSTVSRMIGQLVRQGEVRGARSTRDRRTRALSLTPKGRRTLARIEDFGNAQVSAALARLPAGKTAVVLEGLESYARALRGAASPDGAPAPVLPQGPVISRGYAPGLLGGVSSLIARHMHRHAGFGLAFERKVAGDMAAFLARADGPGSAIWRAEADDGRLLGAIAIDGEGLGDGLAHLRWFILAPEARGRGLGKALLRTALAHVDAHGFRGTKLWTVSGLDTARALYERAGFRLVEACSGDQWGSVALEQVFERPRP